MSVLDGAETEAKRVNCGSVMQVNITGNVMPVNLGAGVVMPVNIQGAVMQVALCWPDIEVETVTVNGEALTVDGEPVYVLIPD